MQKGGQKGFLGIQVWRYNLLEFVLEFVLKYIFDERWIKTLNWMMSQNLKNITGKLYYNIKVGLISSLLKIRKVESDVLIFSNILLYINLRNFKRYNFNSAKMIKQNMIFMLLLLLLLNVNFGKFQKITQTISQGFQYAPGFTGKRTSSFNVQIPDGEANDQQDSQRQESIRKPKIGIQLRLPPIFQCRSNFQVRHLAFRTKMGESTQYLTYPSGCSGYLTFQLPSGPGESPGSNQQFIGHSFGPNIFVYQPKSCNNMFLRQVIFGGPPKQIFGMIRLSTSCTKIETNTMGGNSIISVHGSVPTRYWLTGSPNLLTSSSVLSPYIVQYWA